jgi:hypothetical protein
MIYLMQIVGAAAVTFAFGADIFVFKVLPIRVTVALPESTRSVEAALAHCAATFFAAMFEQLVPRRGVKVADRALVMMKRISNMLFQRAIGCERAVASVAPPIRS